MSNAAHMASNLPDLITTAEVAEILGKSVPTVNRWAAEGRLQPAQKLPGQRGAYLFRRADVEALMDTEASA